MNFKTTLILLAVLVLAGGYIIFEKVRSGDKDQVETTEPGKIFAVKDRDDVTSLTIKSADGSEIVLNKDEKQQKWRMTKPVGAPAETFQVDGLVRDLLDLKSTAEVDPKDKGLDKPAFRVEMGTKDGKLLKLAVGEKNQLGNLYVQVEGKKQADVVSSDVYERLSKPANELRDKQLVTASSADVRQLRIQTDEQNILLQKKGADWQVVEPKPMPADDMAVSDLVAAVTGLRATDWIAPTSAEIASRAQFDKPQMTVSFTTGAPATQPATAPASQPTWIGIVFGAYEDARHNKIYAKLSEPQAVVKVSSSPFETLNKKPLDLRDKKVIDILPEQVSKLSIVTDIPASPAPAVKPAKKTTVQIERRKQVAQAAAPAAAAATAPAAPAAGAAKPTTQPSATKPAATRASAATQASAATKPTTRPATQVATTHPATQPATPPSPWVLLSEPKGEADEPSVTSLLNELHPLRVTKYLESTPTTKPTGTYTLKFTTEGPGGTPVTDYQLNLIDPGGDRPLMGEYNGLSFELPRTFLTKLEGHFAKKPKTETPGTGGATPDSFNLSGEK